MAYHKYMPYNRCKFHFQHPHRESGGLLIYQSSLQMRQRSWRHVILPFEDYGCCVNSLAYHNFYKEQWRETYAQMAVTSDLCNSYTPFMNAKQVVSGPRSGQTAIFTCPSLLPSYLPLLPLAWKLHQTQTNISKSIQLGAHRITGFMWPLGLRLCTPGVV